jgi:hypothetical protein
MLALVVDTKKCPRCDIVKPLGEFSIRRTGRVGHPVDVCKSCQNVRNIKAKDGDPSIYRRITWPSKLKRLYGLTVADYYAMLKEQGGGCAICGTTDPTLGIRRTYARGTRAAFDVDHNHETGKVRGLLCSICNRLVGLAKDDARVAMHLVSYLLRKEG